MGPSDLEALNVVIKRFFLLIQIKIVFNLNWLITFAKPNGKFADRVFASA